MQWNMELLKLLKVPQFPNDLKQIIEDAMKAAGSDIGELRIKRATVTLAQADIETKGRVSASDFKINDGERAIVQVVSTYHLDRDNEVVIPDGIQLSQFNKSGRAFAWNHNYSLGALGVDEKIGSDGGRIIAKSIYSDNGPGTLANIAFNLRQMGTTQSSIGFIPTDSIEAGDNNWTRSLDKFRATWKDFEQDDEKIKRIITKSILLEHSDVFLASNFNTTVLAKAQELGADDAMVKKMFGVEVSGMPMGDPSILAKAKIKDVEPPEVKRPIPFSVHGDGPKSAEGAAWNGPREIAAAEVDDLKIMATWVDAENPDIKSSYKLPHHTAAGTHPAVLRGVQAAMGALLGARGGVDIPDADRRGVFNHLAKHLKQFDREPPEFREYTETELKGLFPEMYPKVVKYHVELVKPAETEYRVELVTDGPRKASEIISEKVKFEVDMATGKV